mmetsp:Transcript_2840/g.7435  ORF Transcript_2840/g.7435 Transcript_2840/m.7435 type:complete len:202 (+) Transcript_2840:328-933(+)
MRQNRKSGGKCCPKQVEGSKYPIYHALTPTKSHLGQRSWQLLRTSWRNGSGQRWPGIHDLPTWWWWCPMPVSRQRASTRSCASFAPRAQILPTTRTPAIASMDRTPTCSCWAFCPMSPTLLSCVRTCQPNLRPPSSPAARQTHNPLERASKPSLIWPTQQQGLSRLAPQPPPPLLVQLKLLPLVAWKAWLVLGAAQTQQLV